VHKGVQQGEALACLLFNITLEYAIRKTGMQTRGTISYKLALLMAYVDDIVIISRSLASMKKLFSYLLLTLTVMSYHVTTVYAFT